MQRDIVLGIDVKAMRAQDNCHVSHAAALAVPEVNPCLFSVRDFIDQPPALACFFVLVWRLPNVANHRHNHNYIRSDNRRYNTASLHVYSRCCPVVPTPRGRRATAIRANEPQHQNVDENGSIGATRRLLHLRAHISLCVRVRFLRVGCGSSIKQKRAITAQNLLVASYRRC